MRKQTKVPKFIPSVALSDGLEILRHLCGYSIFEFSSQEQWRSWRSKNQAAFSKESIRAVVDETKTRGAYSPWLGLRTPNEVICRSDNFRESLMVAGYNPRQRVVLDLLAASFISKYDTTRVYAPEYVTRFARELEGKFRNFYGSEYIPDQDIKKRESIPHEDLADLSLKDRSVDVVVANEVFEHLPHLDRSIGEISRILDVGGVLIATFPFYTNAYETHKKAFIDELGKISFLSVPEYHGNPIDPKGGSLVFQVPGWDILETCKKQGFEDAKMYLMGSSDCGIVSADMMGILLLISYKCSH